MPKCPVCHYEGAFEEGAGLTISKHKFHTFDHFAYGMGLAVECPKCGVVFVPKE